MHTERPKASELSQSQREIAVVRLCSRGVKARDCIAYHGTSLEAVQHLIRYGSIPGHTDKDYSPEHLPKRGDIYFLPRMVSFPFDRLPVLLQEDRIGIHHSEFALKTAKSIAQGDAPGMRMCSALGIDGSYSHLMSCYLEFAITTPESIEARTLFQEYGFTERQISLAMRAARKRRNGGVLLALSRKALDMYPLSEGDMGNDFRLSTGTKGLTIEAISGLRMLGYEEKSFIRKLRKKHGI